MKNLNTVLSPLVASTISTSALAMPPEKIQICHFEEDAGIWTMKSLSEAAAFYHLLHHDDAEIGTTTAETATLLDDFCQVVEAVYDDKGRLSFDDDRASRVP